MPASVLNGKETKKTSAPETGHAKNAALLNELISCVKSYGAAYKPSKEELSAQNMETTRSLIDNSITAVSNAETKYKNAVAERAETYEKMSSFSTRVQDAVAVFASDKEMKNLSSIAQKVRGSNRPKRKEKEKEEGTDSATHSTSQMGHDNRLKNFRDLCIFVKSIPEYNPNEQELQIASMENYAASLSVHNQNVKDAWNELDNARTARNKIMYGSESASELFKKVKKYVRSLYGASSQEYKKIAKLSFKTYKN